MLYSCMCAQWLSHVYLFATPQTVVCQAPLSMRFPRQEYWNRLPFPTPGDLPQPRDQTRFSYIGRQILYHCATREVPAIFLAIPKYLFFFFFFLIVLTSIGSVVLNPEIPHLRITYRTFIYLFIFHIGL